MDICRTAKPRGKHLPHHDTKVFTKPKYNQPKIFTLFQKKMWKKLAQNRGQCLEMESKYYGRV